jgi:hypothetical protein
LRLLRVQQLPRHRVLHAAHRLGLLEVNRGVHEVHHPLYRQFPNPPFKIFMKQEIDNRIMLG